MSENLQPKIVEQKVLEVINAAHQLTKSDNYKPFYRQNYKVSSPDNPNEEIEINLEDTNYGLSLNRTLAIHINQEANKINQYNQSKDNLGEIKLNPPVSDFNAFLEKYSAGYDYGTDQGIVKSLQICTFYKDDGKMYGVERQQVSDYMIKNYKDKGLPIPQITIYYSGEYIRLQGKLIAMGYSREVAEMILNVMDSRGICTNADLCNAIFYEFSNSPEEFEKVFGYPMFIEDKDGNQLLNSAELLLDVYIYVNDKENHKNYRMNYLLQGKNINPILSESKPGIDIFGDPVYNSGENSYHQALIDFLHSKHPNLEYSQEIKEYITKEEAQELMDDGKMLTLRVPSYDEGGNQPFVMKGIGTEDVMTDHSWGAGHVASITAATDEGLIISSWGNKYQVSYESLNQPNAFIMATNIEMKW